MHRPKEDLSLLLQYMLHDSKIVQQYNDGRKINRRNITVIYYKYGTITVRCVELATSATELNVSGPQINQCREEGELI